VNLAVYALAFTWRNIISMCWPFSFFPCIWVSYSRFFLDLFLKVIIWNHFLIQNFYNQCMLGGESFAGASIWLEERQTILLYATSLFVMLNLMILMKYWSKAL